MAITKKKVWFAKDPYIFFDNSDKNHLIIKTMDAQHLDVLIGGGVNPQSIFDNTEDSDTVTREIDDTTGKVKFHSTGSGGTTDYDELTNKPQINGVELTGNKTTSDLKLTLSQILAVDKSDHGQGIKLHNAQKNPTSIGQLEGTSAKHIFQWSWDEDPTGDYAFKIGYDTNKEPMVVCGERGYSLKWINAWKRGLYLDSSYATLYDQEVPAVDAYEALIGKNYDYITIPLNTNDVYGYATFQGGLILAQNTPQTGVVGVQLPDGTQIPLVVNGVYQPAVENNDILWDGNGVLQIKPLWNPDSPRDLAGKILESSYWSGNSYSEIGIQSQNPRTWNVKDVVENYGESIVLLNEDMENTVKRNYSVNGIESSINNNGGSITNIITGTDMHTNLTQTQYGWYFSWDNSGGLNSPYLYIHDNGVMDFNNGWKTVNFNDSVLTSTRTPENDTDLVNKKYVDGLGSQTTITDITSQLTNVFQFLTLHTAKLVTTTTENGVSKSLHVSGLFTQDWSDTDYQRLFTISDANLPNLTCAPYFNSTVSSLQYLVVNNDWSGNTTDVLLPANIEIVNNQKIQFTINWLE